MLDVREGYEDADIHAQFFMQMHEIPDMFKDTTRLVLSEEEHALFDWNKLAKDKENTSRRHGEKLFDVTYRVGLQADPSKAFVCSVAFTHENIMKTIESLVSYYVKLVDATNGFALGILIYNSEDKFNLPGDYMKRLVMERLVGRDDAKELLHKLSTFAIRVMELQTEPIGVKAIKLAHLGDEDPYKSCQVRLPNAPLQDAPAVLC